MHYQQGFTLVELMIVVGIVAILSAIGLPAYQNYLQRAALTDMLQTMVPFKTAVELCAIERGGPEQVSGRTTRYSAGHNITLRVGDHRGQRHDYPDRAGEPEWIKRRNAARLGQ